MPDRHDIVDWSIPGSGGEAILGNTHLPSSEPIGVGVIAHGFKGYKDYGMFPRIASTCASAGLIAHRFNFSHSGMTPRTQTFERPDLFEKDFMNPPSAQLDRIYVDSLVHDDRMLRYLIDLFTPQRIALGSDYPFPLGEHEPGKLIDSLTDVPPADRERMLSGTALEFLGAAAV